MYEFIHHISVPEQAGHDTSKEGAEVNHIGGAGGGGISMLEWFGNQVRRPCIVLISPRGKLQRF
jgi:hypothetical protein